MDELIDIVCSKTDYDRDMAKKKLMAAAFDEKRVIRDFLGLNAKKPIPAAAAMQKEIFRQFRVTHNKHTREYDEFKAKQEADLALRQQLKKEREAAVDSDSDEEDDVVPDLNAPVILKFQPACRK